MSTLNDPRESTLVRQIVAALRATPGVVVRKRHGSSWSVAGDPDLYGSFRGRHFEIEVKRPGADGPTPLQQTRLQQWAAVGALVGVARSVDEALRIVGANGKVR
ncbi:MAG: VRR-NUC domain-containing protein [Acidobacteria bacterium]|nr:VRR-NUC domain-containing protein [Acidobacteriota bacterium]